MPEFLIEATGTILVLFSAFCFRHRGVARGEARSPAAPAERRPHQAFLLVAMNGFLVLVALAALLGIWFGNTGGK